jgi:hypothetical protein
VIIQQRLIRFVTRSNWVIFAISSVLGLALLPLPFAAGIFFGGLLVTLNFHLLSKTLKTALTPPHMASPSSVIAKYYFRFVVSGVIIFSLIWGQIVNPVGLIIGLSVVVASIMLATMREIKLLLCKEAV